MYQAEQVPLSSQLVLSSEVKPIEVFVAPYIAKHRLNHGHTVIINLFAKWAIHAMFHPVGEVARTVAVEAK